MTKTVVCHCISYWDEKRKTIFIIQCDPGVIMLTADCAV